MRPDGGVAGGDGTLEQARAALAAVSAALDQAGASAADVVQTRMSLTDITRWADAAWAHAEVFGDHRPAATMVEVSALIDPRLLI